MDEQQIIAYLKGELSQSERLDFEKRLSQDPALAEATQFWSLLLAADSAEGRAFTQAHGLIKDVVKQEMPHLAGKGKRKAFLRSPWWIAGAVIVLAVVVGGYYFYKSEHTEPAKKEVTPPSSSPRSSLDEEVPVELDTAEEEAETEPPAASTPSPAAKTAPKREKRPDRKEDGLSVIASAKFVPFKRLGTTMGGRAASDTLNVTFEAAFEAYHRGKPEKVIELLDQKAFDDVVEALKLRANAYYQLGDYQAAIQILELLQTDIGPRGQAEWNLLVCSILADKAWPASLVEKLSDEDHPYRDSLYRLLPHLKQ